MSTKHKGGLKLSGPQKDVIRQMREYNYFLIYDKVHMYFSFERNGRDVSKYVSSSTENSIRKRSLLIANIETEKRISYSLSELGKTIEL